MAMPPSWTEPMCCAGEVVPIGMTSGKKQQEEAWRQARLQSRMLTQEEKDAIQRRRAAISERRRAALASAEHMAGPAAPLQARIQQRRVALQDALKQGGEEDNGSTQPLTPEFGEDPAVSALSHAQPKTPEFGQAPSSPPSPVQLEADDERRRKSRRITFSAITGALDDISPDRLPEAESGIQASQELAASLLVAGQYKPRFSVASHCPPQSLSRGAKRSIDGLSRNSVGAEAMEEKAKVLTGCSNASSDGSDNEEACKNSDLLEELPLLATPGRFRNRGSGSGAGEDDPWSTLEPQRSSPSRALPPPPSRPVKQPSKRLAAFTCVDSKR